ncbi:MAG TPA: hypothetical protein VGO00_02935 [Kofleriaceae bacterium]|nr:hypothetical protein [Kofleriaceae bacterium]
MMTSRARKLENAKVIRGLIGVGIASVGAALVFAGPFWLLASWNGAIDRFSDAHPVLDVVLGVSVLFLACLPAAYGVFSLVMPDVDVRSSGLDGKPKGRIVNLHTSTREACIWIAAGGGYAAIIGAVIHHAG